MSTVARAAMKDSLKVAMARSAALTRWLWGGDKLDVHPVGTDVFLHGLGTFVVHDVEGRLIVLRP